MIGQNDPEWPGPEWPGAEPHPSDGQAEQEHTSGGSGVWEARQPLGPSESASEPQQNTAPEPDARSLWPSLPTESCDTQPAQEVVPGSYFAAYGHEAPPLPVRFPNFADVALVAVLLVFGWMGSGALLGVALHYHLGGVADLKQAMNDVRYTLGSQAAWYVFSFLGCLALFPAIWHLGFFEGIEWRARAAFSKRWRLITAALLCFVVAIIDGVLLPGPPDTPIDQVFRMPGAAWLLFGFGITLAPFFEELAYRGFLLPALCTACDWVVERITHRPPPVPDLEGKIPWSIGAMALGSLLTSIPFALMHAEQTGYSIGPFLLLVGVSLVLCWIRLSTRSLAASTLVHSSYNLLLFSLMLAGTGGFKHLDKM